VVKKYRVVFLGLLEGEEDFVRSMSRLGVPPSTAEQIIQKAPIVLKGEMTLGDARQYADAIQLAGGKVNIQDHGLFQETKRVDKSLDIEPLENFTMCPECGYKQLRADVCVKCSFVFNEET